MKTTDCCSPSKSSDPETPCCTAEGHDLDTQAASLTALCPGGFLAHLPFWIATLLSIASWYRLLLWGTFPQRQTCQSRPSRAGMCYCHLMVIIFFLGQAPNPLNSFPIIGKQDGIFGDHKIRYGDTQWEHDPEQPLWLGIKFEMPLHAFGVALLCCIPLYISHGLPFTSLVRPGGRASIWVNSLQQNWLLGSRQWDNWERRSARLPRCPTRQACGPE